MNTELTATATTTKMNKDLTTTEQNLLNELNYKAKLILNLERMFKDRKVPVNTKSLYTFSTAELETVQEIWTGEKAL